ncbi:MAG: hypothetical protein J7K23_06605 [Thermoproteales archaeon]|nr:hypothetical protein [Thermoproteales archaeon]
MDFYSSIIQGIISLIGDFLKWPMISITSTIIVFLVIVVLRLIYFFTVKEDEINRIMVQINKWEERKKRAIEKKDMKMYRRVMREEKRIEKLKNQIEKKKMIGSILTTISWIIFFKITSDIVGSRPVVLFPLFNYSKIAYPTWFMINTIWGYLLVDKVIRLFIKNKSL